ncbi:MAG: hypothetical protein DRR08_13210 [Candidatus Parabeggiatoa sp. nov. 2]|nr:MAG: hypothetical protein B6247_05910 [Beggiatoa sp. 4572_84]RKZ59740.1 MAG: hypothetical protein DRR08_13210 [Gammaproteobacteria bacterium]
MNNYHRLFIFNPYRVDAKPTKTTGCPKGYSYSTPLGLRLDFTITTGFTCGYSYSTPSGLRLDFTITTGCTGGYSYSTPTGLTQNSQKPQVAPVAIHIQPLQG